MISDLKDQNIFTLIFTLSTQRTVVVQGRERMPLRELSPPQLKNNNSQKLYHAIFAKPPMFSEIVWRPDTPNTSV